MGDEAKIDSTTGTGGPGGSPAGDPPPAAQEWFTGLPDTLKTDAAVFEPFKDKPVTDVLTAYRDLSVKAADFAMPASAKEYGIKVPALPEGVPLDQAALDAFLERSFKAGVPPKALQAMVDQTFADNIAAHEENKKASATADKVLREKWGGNYVGNIALVAREMRGLPKEMVDVIEKSGLGNHPHLVELIHLVATAKREGTLHSGGDEGAGKRPIAERLYDNTPPPPA